MLGKDYNSGTAYYIPAPCRACHVQLRSKGRSILLDKE